ncbi:MAG: type IV pilin protein [Candidatus Paceibacteria bacterium]
MLHNNKNNTLSRKSGFSLMELLVVVAIIGILAMIVYANFNNARATARDEARKVALKEMQLAIELYKAQEGRYPVAGCGAGTSFTATGCYPYIVGLTPDYISELPRDPSGNPYRYRTNTNGSSYKLLTERVEADTVTEGSDFARCPSFTGCSGASSHARTYAVYGGPGSVNW